MRPQTHISLAEIGKVNDLGCKVASFVIGELDDPLSTEVYRVSFPPGVRVAPHTHDVDYAEIILEGTQMVTGRWFGAGDVRIVKAGTVYGPLVAGPNGAEVIVIFRNNNSARPVPPRRDGSEVLVDLVDPEVFFSTPAAI